MISFGSMPQKIRSYQVILDSIKKFGRNPFGVVTEVGRVQSGKRQYPVLCVQIDQQVQQPDLPTIFITAGIHGNEPGGVWAAIELLNRCPDWPDLYKPFSFTILPCTNPYGYEYNTRENAEGIDLNRQFRDSRPPPEVSFIKKMVAGRAYSLTMEFHEDIDSPGFYLYELIQKGEAPWGRNIINVVSKRFPINRNREIEGTSADSGLILRQDGDSSFHQFVNSRADWPQAFYHFTNGTRRSYTTEPPTSLTDGERTEIHLMALDVAIRKLWEEQSHPSL